MHLQNWYAVLSVPSTASTQEIRQAYRRLAHQYHPDKNPENDQSSLHFQLIKEAYEVLSNPARRSAYDRLVYLGNTLQNIPEIYNTPAELTAAANRLYQQVMRENQFFINRDWLMAACMELLSAENRQLLIGARDQIVTAHFLKIQFKLAGFLTYSQNLILQVEWNRLCSEYPTEQSAVVAHMRNKKRAHIWEQYSVPAAILIGLIIVTLIFLS